MTFTELDLGVSQVFEEDIEFEWKLGPHKVLTLQHKNGQGSHGRFIIDPSTYTNLLNLELNEIFNNVSCRLTGMSSYKFEGEHDGIIGAHSVLDKLADPDLFCIVILHGNDNISIVTHDCEGKEKIEIEDGQSWRHQWIEPGAEPIVENYLKCSQVKQLETYTNKSFIIDNTVPHSFRNTKGVGYITFCLFDTANKEQIQEAFKNYVV